MFHYCRLRLGHPELSSHLLQRWACEPGRIEIQTHILWSAIWSMGYLVHVLLWFFLGPCAFADVHGFRFPECLNIGMASGFPNIHLWTCTTLTEPRTFRLLKLRRSPWEVVCIFEDPYIFGVLQPGVFFLPRGYFLLLSCFDCLDHSSGQIVSSRVVVWTFVGRPFTHVYRSVKVDPQYLETSCSNPFLCD